MMENLIHPDGWLAGVQKIGSPNQDARPPACEVDLLVIHAISLPPGIFGGASIDALFTNTLDPAIDPYFAGIASLRVSAHFLIRRDGALTQYVSCDRRAWHAGASHWRGRSGCNDFSIGIELEGSDSQPFTDVQYERLNWLAAILAGRYPVSAIVGHADIAPDRKTDPGPYFDWSRIVYPDKALSLEKREKA